MNYAGFLDVEDPRYVMPCPACSFLDVADFSDRILTPRILPRARGVAGFLLCGCDGGCRLCGTDRLIDGATVEEVAAAWHERVAELVDGNASRAGMAPGLVLSLNRIAVTFERLRRRGVVPSSFPSLLEKRG